MKYFSTNLSFSAPPELAGNIVEESLHLGHTNWDMFSTIPSTGRETLRQKLISFLTSCRDIS